MISAVIVDDTGVALDESRTILASPDDLYSQANRHIFRAACELSDLNERIDLVTIKNRLEDQNRLQQVGGTPYLMQIIDATPSVSNVKAHARIVRDLARTRRGIQFAQRVAADGYSKKGDARDVQSWLEQAEIGFSDIAHVAAEQHLRELKEVLLDVDQSVTTAKNTVGVVTGTPMGLVDFDEATTGVHDGDVMVIAGRPGMGKTGLALSCAASIGAAGYAVPIFSLEMPDLQVGMRLVAAEARLELHKLRSGNLNPTEWTNFTGALNTLQSQPIFVDDTAGINVFEVRARLRRLQKEINAGQHPGCTKGKIGAVIIDYLQLMGSVQRSYSREQEVGLLSRSLKEVAKQLSVPMIVLSQLNREAERRNDHRPQLADLRESGSVEQDADTVCFVFRPAYYDKGDDPALKGLAEIIIAKQRNGPTRTIKVSFRQEYARFDNLVEGDSDLYDPRDRQGDGPAPAMTDEKEWDGEFDFKDGDK